MFPNNLQLRTRVDGEAVQDSSTSNMIFSKHFFTNQNKGFALPFIYDNVVTLCPGNLVKFNVVHSLR